MATCIDVAGVKYPKKYDGHRLDPVEGVSLRPAFKGKPLERKDAIYFEHHLNCAIRDGDWKLVRYGQTGKPSNFRPWELYNMRKDRSELNNLAKENSKKVEELTAKWEAWAVRAKVKPWPWKFQDDQ